MTRVHSTNFLNELKFQMAIALFALIKNLSSHVVVIDVKLKSVTERQLMMRRRMTFMSDFMARVCGTY